MIRGFALLIGDLNKFSWNRSTRIALATGVLLCLPHMAFAQARSEGVSTSYRPPSAAPAVVDPNGADPAMGDAAVVVPSPTQQNYAIPAMGDGGTNSGKGVSVGGITIPTPPPPSAFSASATDLAAQAEQTALRAQAEAEQAKQDREAEHSRKSFERAQAGLYPLSNEQIRAFMKKLESTQDAAVAPSEGQPKGSTRIINLALDPGAIPPVINLSANYVTTVDVLDSTGAPWPILDVGIGGAFEVSPTQSGSHVVRITPLSRVANGNLSILLKDLPTPVIFRLSSGGSNVDLRYEVRVPKFGPNAKIPLVSRPPRLEAGDETILSILQNAPPGDAKRVKIGGLDARTMAWALNGRTYVRTQLQLLSPAWSASVASADGTTVYEIGDAPVLLMSDNGAVVRARLLRDEEHD